MKKISLILSILVLALASSACAAPEGALGDAKKTAETKAAPAPAAVQERPYLIGPSDVLDISVWGEAALSRQVTVRTDGFISLPLVGDIAAVGKSPSQLQKGIENSLMKFIKDPHCAVIVVEPRSKRFYVEGQVVRPGFFLLDQDMNLTQAISLAGGLRSGPTKTALSSCAARMADRYASRPITAGSSRAKTGISRFMRVIPS